MASGTPDYFQTIRQQYGGAKVYGAWHTVTANAFTTLLSVSGKGMIYGGALVLDAAATQKNSYMAVFIDGSSVLASTFERMNEYGHNNPGGYPLSLTMFDEVNFKYAVQLLYGITFETNFRIDYRESHGATPLVNLGLVYALL